MPEGSLYCKNNNGYVQWIRNLNGKKLYIPKSKRKLAEELAKKKYYNKLLPLIKIKAAQITELEKTNSEIENTKKNFFQDIPEMKYLLLDADKNNLQDYSEWMQADFETNPYNVEEKKFETLDGHFVRSKSETIIADMLFENHIPYRYECALAFGNRTFYPDFTVIRPKDGQLMYWEHYGLMDKLVYRNKMLEKMEYYISNNIIPSINFIASYETLDNPLSSIMVQKLVDTYLR